jgi:hypothetical protein
LTVGPDKGETPHWEQRTDTNPPERKRRERRSNTAWRSYSTSEEHEKPRNHISRDTFNITESRDTFTNVTESENSGKLVKETGKRILERTCLKDETK